MSVDDLKQISLGRTLREGVSTVVGSLTLSSCCEFGNLYFVSLTIKPCVFWACVSCLQSGSFGKFQPVLQS